MSSLRASNGYQKPFEYGVDDSVKADSAIESSKKSRPGGGSRSFLKRGGIFQWMFTLSLILSGLLPGLAISGPTNGGFEDGNLNGWTVVTYLNNGITYTLPITRDKLNLQPGGTNLSSAVTSGSYVTPIPNSGTYSAVVNNNGASYNVNSMHQTFTVVEGDRRPDGKIHVVFAAAPVLDNSGGHGSTGQPYYFVEVTNVTKGTTLYRKFNYAGEEGANWLISGNFYYTNWQVADIAPGDAFLAAGDQVKIEIIGAGCSASGHAGWVYVDTVGNSYPGLTVSASGPAAAQAGDNITYSFSYNNGGGAAATNAVVTLVTPPNTTYQSSTGSCSGVSVGGTGTLTCNLGTVNSNGYGAFDVTVNIDSGATGTITNGNYYISADGVSPMYGAAISTDILPEYTVTTSPGANGTLSCTPNPVISGATTDCTATATTAGYHVATISGCGINYNNSSNTIVTHTATSTAITGACTVSAAFAINQYTVSASAGAGGALSGSTPSPQVKNYGATHTFTFNANTGYHITGISGCSGPAYNPGYTIDTLGVTTYGYTTGAITVDCSVTATFDIDVFSITPSIYNQSTGEPGTGGSLSCPATANWGTNPSCAVAADSGYHVYEIWVDGVEEVAAQNHSITGNNATQTAWSLGNTTAARTILAKFRLNTFSVTAGVTGGNGSVTCPNPYEDFDARPICTITPNTGYHVYDLTVTGTTNNIGFSNHSITGDNSTIASYQLYGSAAPGSNRTINATFRLNTYLVSAATAGSGSGMNTVTATANPSNYADYGSSATFSVDESDGSQIDSVTGNGNCGSVTGTPKSDTTPVPPSSHGQTATYTASSVTDVCTVTATFSSDITKPAVAMFSIPASEPDLSLAVVRFKATDNVHVKDYCLTEVNNFTGCLWSTTPQTDYTFADGTLEGIHTLYGWARDYAGTVSDPYPAIITLDFPGRAELAQTGQNLCYDDLGLIVACTATRQDGDTRAGIAWPVPRFTNPGGGTPISGDLVEDRLTGFTWARDGNLAATRGFDADGMVAWENALAFIETLNAANYGGHNDWRLPNRNELNTLINRQRSDNASWLGTLGFANVKPNPYWTSTTALGSPDKAWTVNFLEGSMVGEDKGASLRYVFPVRGWNGDGLVQTLQTGQSTCYNAAGSEIGCVPPATGIHSGQDGDERAGKPWMSPRFTNVNGNAPVTGAVVVDQSTKLMWLRDGGTPTLGLCSGGSLVWQGALNYVKCLNTNNYLGYDDWRLPDTNELLSLGQAGTSNGAEWLNDQGFQNLSTGKYWSSTTDVNQAFNTWAMTLGDGELSYYNKATVQYLTLPVRGGQIGSGVLSVDPSAFNFGPVVYGTASPRILTITNNGTTPLEIVSMILSGTDAGMFTIDSGAGTTPCGSLAPVIDAGSHCTVGIVFEPSSSGNKTTLLTLLTSDPAHSETTVTLDGTGVSQITVIVNGQGTAACDPNPAASGSTSTCTASSDSGRHIVSISGCGGTPYAPGYTIGTAGVTGYDYTTGVVNTHCTVTVDFAINQYNVSATAGAGGSLSGSTPSPVVKDYSATHTFTFNADAGRHIVSVSGCGGTAYSPVYTIGTGVTTYDYTTGPVSADCTVTATFAINQYNVSATAGAGGSLSGSTPSPVVKDYHTTQTFTFNADTGYHIVSVSGCGGTAYNPVYVIGTAGATTVDYTTGSISADCTVNAAFAVNQYNVSAAAGAGGSLSGSTPSPVVKDYHTTQTFTFNADTGYHIVSVSGCGGTAYNPAYVIGTDGATTVDYTTGPISADCAVTAAFAVNQYTLTAAGGLDGQDGVGGTVNPGTQTISYGLLGTITITIGNGFAISSTSSTCGGSLVQTGSNATYTTDGLTADCTVRIFFQDLQKPVIGSLVLPAASASFTVPIIAINATDNHRVSGYYVSPDPNLPGSPVWSPTAPATYTFPPGTPEGRLSLYAWVRDPSGNIGDPAGDTVIITLPAAVQLSETGQTQCYDADGGAIDCNGTGQDGFWRAGIPWSSPRFKDNQDGSFSDLQTGNMNPQDANVLVNRNPGWQGSADGKLAWQEALDYIKKLNDEFYLGYNDWRLPNLTELISLHQYQNTLNAWLPTQGFINVQTGSYWTSTTVPSSTEKAYTVKNDGTTETLAKVGAAFVFPIRNDLPLGGTVRLLSTDQTLCYDTDGTAMDCVNPLTGAHTGQDGDIRAGIPWLAERFTVSAGVAADQQTGLEWPAEANTSGPEACGPGTAKTWQETLDFIACLNQHRYLGFPDWRLPNALELLSLANLTESDGAAWLQTKGIAQVQSSPYWTADTDPGTPANALTVTLGTPGISTLAKASSAAVWPVRGGYLPEYPYITEQPALNGTLVCTPNPVARGNPSTCTATADTNYHVASISGCGGTVYTNNANNITTYDYATGAITGHCTVTAAFAINHYTVTYQAGAHGSISGTSPQTVDHGASGTAATAVPDAGYHFVQWSDGVLTASRTDSNVTGTLTVTASFAINTYLLTYNAGPGGSISGTSPQTVDHGASGAEVTALPGAGYHFVQWSDGVLTPPPGRTAT